MHTLLALALLGAVPHGPIVTYVDEVEQNFVCNDDGSVRIDQMIFRLHNPPQIVAWAWSRHCQAMEYKNGWLIVWKTTDDDCENLAFIWSRYATTTFTDYDRETHERKWLPVEKRRGVRLIRYVKGGE